MLRLNFLLFILVLVLAAGCTSEGPQGKLPPPLVEVMTVTARDEPVSNTFFGQTAGSKSVEVRAQVSGILKSRTYEEGHYVEKGKLLFEIDPDTYRAALEQARGAQAQAQALFTQARQNLDRVLPLYARNAVSQMDRDNAQASYNSSKANLEAARAAVNEAEIRLSYAYVTAPVSGFTGQEERTIGNLISAGSADSSLLTVINQLNPIYANFSIPSPQFMRMRVLQAQGRLRADNVVATIALADGSVYPHPGKITFIDRQVNAQTSVVAARAEFENPEAFVLPGQFVRVTISGIQLVKAMLIPQKAILQTSQGSMVVVIGKDNIAEMRAVQLGDNYGDSFLVNGGLTSGERIVVEGGNKVIPGKPVRLAAQPDKTSPTPALPANLKSDSRDAQATLPEGQPLGTEAPPAGPLPPNPGEQPVTVGK